MVIGRSFRTDQPVFNLILERYPATIELRLWPCLLPCETQFVGRCRREKSVHPAVISVSDCSGGISLPSFVIGPMRVYLLR